ncbi:MFS transporter [Corynebacterium stationis]|uniref:MFS transporter n=1 Tax=Corynebacterium stationis TaxID=1705 RepID=UPI00260FEC17|nr:MFS transporter [Corynebacterium stationis]
MAKNGKNFNRNRLHSLDDATTPAPKLGPDATQAPEKVTLWKVPGFAPTMVAVAAAFGAWSILLPVVPTQVIEAGGSPALAGASTGIFMAATVLTQIFTPWMLRKFGYRRLMAVSAFMLGVPALGHIFGTETWAVLLFSALRGTGFGALTVAESALMAELVPLKYLGKATGVLGVFVGAAQMVFLPIGLYMSSSLGYEVTYITAAVIAVIAVGMVFRIPDIHPKTETEGASTSESARPRVSIWKLVLVPALGLSAISMSYGLVSSFLPATVTDIDPVTGATLGGIMLSIVGGSAMVSRYFAGSAADRFGEAGRLYIPGQLTSFVGMALMAAVILAGWSVWWLVVAAALFGIGFGVVQQEALLSMFQRLPRTRSSEASALWNISYDGGTGVGSIVFAGVVAGAGYAGGYAAGAVVILIGVGLTSLDHLVGKHRVTEYDNIKTRLKRLRKEK